MTTTVKPRRTRAVFMKQLKDTLKNKATLIQFVMFPLLAFILTEAIAKGQPNLPNNYFVIMFSTMYAGFVPMVTMSSIISEEKETHTLRVLMMANVKPWQYLMGTGGYVFLLSVLGAGVFGFIGGYVGWEFARFMAVMMCGVLASLLLGAAVGILSKNQMTSVAIVMPVAMVAAFMPMISMFNERFEAVAQVLYTQQISYMVSDISVANMTLTRFLIIGINMLVFVVLFVVAYKRGTLSGD